MTGRGAGRGRHRVPVVMAQRRDLAVHVAVAAGAGVGGKALLRAGRRGQDRVVIVYVGQLRDRFDALLTAAPAGIGALALPGLRGLLRDLAFAPVMAQGGGLVAPIGIAASGAGVDGKPALRAGRRGYGRRIVMPQGGGPVAPIGIAASGAGIDGKSALRAGRRGYGRRIVMPQGGGPVAPVAVAAFAGVGGKAGLGAGGGGDDRLVGMLVRGLVGELRRPVQEGHDLSAGAGGVRPEQRRGSAGGDALLHGPGHGLTVITVPVHVRERGRFVLRRGLTGVSPQEGHDLRSGADLIGTEARRGDAGGDLLLHRPEDGAVIILIRLDV